MGVFGVVAVAVALLLLLGGINQSFLNSKSFSDIFPASGHGVPVQTGMFSRGGWLFFKVPFCDFTSQLGHWKLLQVVAHLCYWIWGFP